MRKITVLRSSHSLYRLALAWPAVEHRPVPGFESDPDPWTRTTFNFKELAHLADVSPRETLAGFIRLKAHRIIRPDGTLDEKVEKFFKAEALAGFGLKVKPSKEKSDPLDKE